MSFRIGGRIKSDSKQLGREVTCVQLDHTSVELYDGYPASDGNMDGTNDHYALSHDPSMDSDLPSRICSHNAIQHALLTGASFKDGDSGDVGNVP
jgi:hypothetical protein